MKKIAPLSSSFMLVGLLGLIISVFYIYPTYSKTWGFTIAVLCLGMLVASLISMAYSPDIYDELEIGPKKKSKK